MKRKQAAASSTAATSSSRKRVKHAHASPSQAHHPHGEVDYEKEYRVKAILDEKGSKYLIDWEPDEETGQVYEPTWEPKANANKEAKADWKRKRAEDRAALPSIAGPASEAPKKRGRGRPRKVKPEWQPPASWDRSGETQVGGVLTPEQAEHEEPDHQKPDHQELEIVESPESQAVSGAEQEHEVAAAVYLSEPIVQPSDPPSSFQAGTYQKLTSSSSQPLSNGAVAGVHQSQTVPVNFESRVARVIPDSQTLVEFSSSAPAVFESDPKDFGVPAIQASEPSSQIFAAPSSPAPAQQEDSQHGGSISQSAVPVQSSALNESVVEALQSAFGKVPESSVLEKPAPNTQDPSLDDPQSQPRNTESQTITPPAQDKTQIGQEDQPSQNAGSSANIQPRQQTLSAPSDEEQPPKSFPESATTAAAPRSSVLLQITNGTASEVRANTASPTRPSTGRSTASTFPFQTQFARPGTSASQVSPLVRNQAEAYPSGSRVSSLPAAQSAALHSLSAIPSVPSRFTRTLGESAPPRPVTPSSEISFASQGSGRAMDTSQASVRSTPRLIDTLNAIREESRRNSTQSSPQAVSQQSQQSPAFLTQAPKLVSNLLVEEQNCRSPSAVPAIEPAMEFSQEEQNTSERYPTLFPQPDTNGTLQRTRSNNEGGTLSWQQSKVQSTVQSIHVVPIGLVGHQRDHCYTTPNFDRPKKLLDEFSSTVNPDAELIAGVEAFVQDLRHAAVHMDLINEETATQYEIGSNTQVNWDLGCSGKFRFLNALCDALRDQTVHVAIVMRPGRIISILEAFLQGITVPHRRLSDITSSSIQSETQGLMVTLVSTEDDVGDIQPSPADLLIALEPTVDEECLPIRALMQKGEHSPIRITLVAPCTIEHVDQSVSSALGRLARLRTLVSGVRQYQADAGRLDIGQVSAEDAARRIADYVVADERGEWPIQDLEPLENLDSQTESEIDPPQSGDLGRTTNKRSLDLDGPIGVSGDQQKRARFEDDAMDQALELPTTINPQNLAMTHVSDSIAPPTQPFGQIVDDESTEQGPLTNTEQRLRDMLKETQDRLAEHVQALSDLQYRYEEQRAELVSMTSERNAQAVLAQTATSRMTESMNNGSKLKAERTELMRQLEAANTKLLDHSVPERQEFEALRLRTEQAEKEKRVLEEKLKSAEENIEYFRTAYQDSSQSAQTLASQNTELDNEVAVLRNKATGEQAKLRQLGYDEQTKLLRNENKKLKATAKNYETLMKTKEDEITRLKENGRGRIGTRASSIPRTPRLGSPAKVDGLRGRGSRPGSPAPGEPKAKSHLHPLSRAS